MWSQNMDSLAQTFKVYALDLWGFGYSTREPMDYGYPLYASQLLKFIDCPQPQQSFTSRAINGRWNRYPVFHPTQAKGRQAGSAHFSWYA